MTLGPVTMRRRVADLDAAVPFYEALADSPARRFSFSGVDLAAVGPFLLFAGPDEVASRLEAVAATIAVEDLAAHEHQLLALGAEVVAPSTATPNGHRLVARHPDGAVVEYVGP